MIHATKEAKLQARTIVRDSHIFFEARDTNIAIKSRAAIQIDIFLQWLPCSKINDFDNFPLSSQLGFIHAIPEQEFTIGKANITDVGFLGLFPKQIFQTLRTYAKEIEQSNEDSTTFHVLQNWLISAFIYRPIMIQKMIHILLAAFKKYLEKLDKRHAESADNNRNIKTPEVSPSQPSSIQAATSALTTPPPKIYQKCYATKCCILQAKGIIKKPMLCTTNRTVCCGCCNEAAKQKLVSFLENELLRLSIDNAHLVPLLSSRMQPISNKAFQKLWQCLPTFVKTCRNDHKFGAATYLANTFGILLDDTSSSHTMDEPLTTRKKNDLWRQASFMCQCHCRNPRDSNKYMVRTFCITCSYVIPIDTISKCPGCNIQDAYEISGALCLSCQFATVVFRNPFDRRLEVMINTWLPTTSDSECSSNISESIPNNLSLDSPESLCHSSISHQNLKKMRKLLFENSFKEIRSRSTPEQNKLVIENITLLQRGFRQKNNEKRDLQSFQSDSLDTVEAVDENLSPRKKGTSSTELHLDSITNREYSKENILTRKNESISKILFPETHSDNTEISL